MPVPPRCPSSTGPTCGRGQCHRAQAEAHRYAAIVDATATPLGDEETLVVPALRTGKG